MADPQDRPDEGADAIPPTPPAKAAAKKAPAKKTPAKKTPAKKTPAKKTPAKKAPAKKLPAKKAPAKKAPAKKAAPRADSPALEPAWPPPALAAGRNGARDAAADAKSSVREAAHPVTGQPRREGGLRVPVSIGLAAAGLMAVVLSRFRRG